MNTSSSMAIACVLDRLDDDARRREIELLGWFRTAQKEAAWTGGEYRFTIASDAVSLARLGELLALERLCCPFLAFRLEVTSDENATLSMSGPDGVEAFIASTFRPV